MVAPQSAVNTRIGSNSLTSTSQTLRHCQRRPLARSQRPIRAHATQQQLPTYITKNAFVDYYELLQVDDDASPAAIKAAYRNLAKQCHPDVHSDGHDICILLNEAYEVLMDPARRDAYNMQLELALKDDEDDYTGEPLSKWMANTKMGKNSNADETRAVFVDEGTCIGCKQCVWEAPATFRIESEYGRSRVFGQWLDEEANLQAAIDACPVSCIHWVERDQLPALEYVMRNVVPRENVGVMMAGQGKPIEDVFTAAARFVKQREAKARAGEASRRYSAQQEAARKAAADALAQQQQQGNWFSKNMASWFGSSGLADAMRANMGYRDNSKVGQRRRQGPVRQRGNLDSSSTIPLERSLVPIRVNAKQPGDYLEY